MKSSDVRHIYDADYFLKQVDGSSEFSEFDGSFEKLHDRYQRNIALVGLAPADRLLEVGCGRGEICIFHSLRGGHATGVDYSADAIQLAAGKALSLGADVHFEVKSFSELVGANAEYEVIIASEFIEHISAPEGAEFMRIARALLNPGGRLLVFTHPNTLQRKCGYPLLRAWSALRGKSLPKTQLDTLSEHYKLYHLNEQNYFSLAGLARQAGFANIKVGYDLPTGSRLFNFVMRTPFRHIFGVNLYLLAVK